MNVNLKITTATHPLDPLSLEELALASSILKREKNLHDKCRFPYLHLAEPDKREVLAHVPGQAFSRHAFALVLDKLTGNTFEALVDLNSQTLVDWQAVDIETQGHAPIMIEEFDLCVEAVQNDPAWRSAVKRRGLTDADIENVQIDPWSFGHFGDDERYQASG